MAGVVGRSGRRNLVIEKNRRAILDRAWDIIAEQLSDPNLDKKIKLDVACKLAVKDMPEKVEGMNLTQTVVMNEIKKAETPLRYNLGNIDAPEDSGHTEQATADNQPA